MSSGNSQVSNGSGNENRTMVMVCTHHLTSPFQVGSHYIYRHFKSLGYQIVYISAPLTPLHRFKHNEDVKVRWQSHRKPRSEKGDIEVIPYSLIAPDSRVILNSKFVLKYWNKFCIPSVKNLLKNHGFSHPDILYIDNIFYHHIIDELKYNILLFRVMDYHPGFPGWSISITKWAKKIAQKADITYYSSKLLEGYVSGLNPKQPVFLPNGIDKDDFLIKLEKGRNQVDLTNQFKRPIAIYVGALGRWFDHELLYKLANSFKRVTFIIYGPYAAYNKRFYQNLKNVHLLGTLDHVLLPATLSQADVGIIPFDRESNKKLVDSINPIKLYEYLLANLSTVSTFWKGIESFKDHIRLAHNHDEFIDHFRDCLQDSQDNKTDLRSVVTREYQWKYILSPVHHRISEEFKPLTSLDVPIIILNWNGIKDTVECLKSVLKTKFIGFKIFLLDNGSDNNEGLVLTQYYANEKRVHVICSPDNLHFTGGINYVYKTFIARENYQFVILLNNDAIVEEYWLYNLVKTSTEHKASLASSKIINYFDRSRMDNAGHFMLNTGEILPIGHNAQERRFDEVVANVGPSGGAALYRRDMIENINFFDDFFTTGYEDAEFGLRASLLGYKSIYCPKAVVYHKMSQSVNKIYNTAYRIQVYRNIYYSYFKLLPRSFLVLNIPFLFIRLVIVVVYNVIFFQWNALIIQVISIKALFTNDMADIKRSRKRFQSEFKDRIKVSNLGSGIRFFIWTDLKRFFRLLKE